MVLESTLTSLLLSIAGRYAHLSSSDVGVGLSGGRLVMDNVRLRAAALNVALGGVVPWKIVEGRAARLRVIVPWSALSHECVTVYVENVFIVAGEGDGEGVVGKEREREREREEEARKDRWHETLLGRLGFNVKVEVNGCKVEYRDRRCVGIVSVASVEAFSADAAWAPAFAPLDGAETGVVAMRKTIRCTGLHFVLLPVEESEEKSFEARYPVVDGIGVTFKVLLCNSDGVEAEDGWHLDVDVELEEPCVCLSARQFMWVSNMGGGGGGKGRRAKKSERREAEEKPSSRSSRSNSKPGFGRSKSREVPAVGDHSASAVLYDRFGAVSPPPSPSQSHGSVHDMSALPEDGADREVETDNDFDLSSSSSSEFSDDGYKFEKGRRAEVVRSARRRGTAQGSNPFYSLWNAIVGEENVDDAVDDAADALGYDSMSSKKGLPSAADLSLLREADDPVADRYRAFDAVATAARSGGYTLRMRLTTPDMDSRELAAELALKLEEERHARKRLENVEGVVTSADARVANAESAVLDLRDKNTDLVKELADLENLTRVASASKDVMIRQMEAALKKAERQLQAIAQEKAAALVKEGRSEPFEKVKQHTVGKGRRKKQTIWDAPKLVNGKTVQEKESRYALKRDQEGSQHGNRHARREADEDGRAPKVNQSARLKKSSRPPVIGGHSKQSTDGMHELAEACSKDGLEVL